MNARNKLDRNDKLIRDAGLADEEPVKDGLTKADRVKYKAHDIDGKLAKRYLAEANCVWWLA